MLPTPAARAPYDNLYADLHTDAFVKSALGDILRDDPGEDFELADEGWSEDLLAMCAVAYGTTIELPSSGGLGPSSDSRPQHYRV